MTTTTPLKTKKFTAAEISRKGRELVRHHQQTQEEYGLIEPEYLLGFEDGDCVDLSEYQALGFPHPKSPKYYKITFDDNMEPQGNAEFINIYHSITRTGKIDDPLLLYYYDGKILVLNGMTRLSVVGQHRILKPGFMRRVPYRLFVGQENHARGEMVRLNLDGRQRVIKKKEFVTMIQLLKHQNMEVGEIRKMITGTSQGSYEINHTITIAYYGCQRLIEQFLKKKIAINAATEIAKIEDPAEQERLLDNYTKDTTLQKLKLQTQGIKAIMPMANDIKGRVLKLANATLELGIGTLCENDIAAIQESIQNLEKIIGKTEAEIIRQASEDTKFVEEPEDDCADMMPEEDIDTSLADEPDATESLSSTPEESRASKSKKNGHEDDDRFEFDTEETGDGAYNAEDIKKGEIKKFVQAWWKEFGSRPVTVGELAQMARDNDVFAAFHQRSNERGHSMWLSKNLLGAMVGASNATGNYWWMRCWKAPKFWYKLQKL